MHWRGVKDFYSGTVLALFGLYVIYSSLQLAYVSEEGPGPGFLPFWLGTGIFALALMLIITSQREPTLASMPQKSWSPEMRAAAAWLALMIAIFLAPFVGFAASLMLLAIYIVAGLERRPLWSALLVGAGLGVGFHLLFVTVLGLSLPTPLGF
jgi:hypothetical protein